MTTMGKTSALEKFVAIANREKTIFTTISARNASPPIVFGVEKPFNVFCGPDGMLHRTSSKPFDLSHRFLNISVAKSLLGGMLTSDITMYTVAINR